MTVSRGAPRRKLAAILILYLLSNSGYLQSSDTSPSVATAASILNEGSLLIDESLQFHPDLPVGPVAGKRYSRFGIGLALLYLPAVALASWTAHLVPLSEQRLVAVFVSFLNPFFGFWACLQFYRIAIHFESECRAAAFGALALGATTSLWPYSVHDHTENLQMLVYLAAYLSLVQGSGARPLKTGLLVATLVLIKPANLVATLPCAVYVLSCAPSPRVARSRLLELGLPIAGAVAVVLGLNLFRYGQLLEFGYGGAMSFDVARAPLRLLPMLLSPELGLLTFNPVLLLALFAWPGFMARWSREGWFALGLFAVLVVLTASFVNPRGGWSWGPRYLVPTIPFLLLPLFMMRPVQATHRLLTGVVLVVSLAIQLLGVLPKSQEYNAIRHTLTDYAPRRFPSQLVGSASLLRQKVINDSNRYPLRSFGIQDDSYVDTWESESFRGFNIWFLHASRQFAWPWLRWLSIPLTVCILVVLWWLLSLGCWPPNEVANRQ